MASNTLLRRLKGPSTGSSLGRHLFNESWPRLKTRPGTFERERSVTGPCYSVITGLQGAFWSEKQNSSQQLNTITWLEGGGGRIYMCQACLFSQRDLFLVCLPCSQLFSSLCTNPLPSNELSFLSPPVSVFTIRERLFSPGARI